MLARLALLTLLTLSAAHAADVKDLLRTGRIDAAVDQASSVARAMPDDLDAQELWIDIMLSLRTPATVQRHYGRRAEADPQSADAHYLVGRAATEPETSIAAYQRALSIDPDHARAHMGMGAMYRTSQQLDLAAASYQRALLRDPSLAEAWGGLLAIFTMGSDRQAILDVAKAAILHVPDHAEAWMVLLTYDTQNTAALLEQALRAVPDDARVHAAHAEFMLREGQGASAVRSADQALKLDPTHRGAQLARIFGRAMAAGTLDVRGYRDLVQAQAMEGTDPVAARTTYDDLVARYPNAPLPYMSRARLRVRTDPTGARQDLERALAVDGDNDEARAALGMLLAQGGHPDLAAPLLTAVAKRRTYDASLLRAAATATFDAGDRTEGLSLIRQAHSTHPGDVATTMQLMAMLGATGDAQGAFEAGRAALRTSRDVRLQIATAAAAQDAGQLEEAATRYEAIALLTGRDAFREVAAKLRASLTQKGTDPDR